MAYPVIDLIAEFFFSIFGNGLIMAIIILALMVMILVTFKANVVVILIVIIPVVVGFVLNQAQSNFIEMPAWFLITLFIMAGLMFSTVFLYLIR